MITNQQIINEILEYIRNGGGRYHDWYVGISQNAYNRLFNEHNVQKDYDMWIYRTTESEQDARYIESYFLNLGTDGGSGGGALNCKMVYAYKKISHTRE